jgi:hypothetical protein
MFHFTFVLALGMHLLLLHPMLVQQGTQDLILLHLPWVPLLRLATVTMTPL